MCGAVSLHDPLILRVKHGIRGNYVAVIIYNVVGIPFAAGIFYPTYGLHLPPMFAGVAMTASSICVVCSSLLLNCYRPPPVTDTRRWVT